MKKVRMLASITAAADDRDNHASRAIRPPTGRGPRPGVVWLESQVAHDAISNAIPLEPRDIAVRRDIFRKALESLPGMPPQATADEHVSRHFSDGQNGSINAVDSVHLAECTE